MNPGGHVLVTLKEGEKRREDAGCEDAERPEVHSRAEPGNEENVIVYFFCTKLTFGWFFRSESDEIIVQL